MKATAIQMELDLGREARRRCTEGRRRRERAAWWFAQMRRAVEAASDPTPGWCGQNLPVGTLAIPR